MEINPQMTMETLNQVDAPRQQALAVTTQLVHHDVGSFKVLACGDVGRHGPRPQLSHKPARRDSCSTRALTESMIIREARVALSEPCWIRACA